MIFTLSAPLDCSPVRCCGKKKRPCRQMHQFQAHDKLPQQHLVGGWATPLKNMKVNWDD